jgi:methylase of polypeptide subunit release factors
VNARLLVADHPKVTALGEALRAAGFTPDFVRARLGSEAYASPSSAVPVFVRCLADDPPSALVRAFFLGEPTPSEPLESALEGVTVGDLEEMGFLALDGSTAEPQARIVPHEGLLLASDRYPRGADEAADYVAGFTGSTEVGSGMTVRLPVSRALDVGAGSGVHALLAAAHSDHVVATDVNPRALAFTAFNARLNRIANVETRLGSLFEPVRGERFGLLVSNPPFVVSPDSRYAFRDAGRRGDELSEEVVRAVPEHLEEGGFATIQASWVGREEDDWEARPRAWVEGSGCDAWIVRGKQQTPFFHAAAWNAEERHDRERFGATLDRWATYLGELGVDWVAEGVIVLRRRSAERNWIRADRVAGTKAESGSDQILRVAAAMDAIGELADDAAILDLPLRPAGSVRIDQTFALGEGGVAPLSTRVRLDDGLRFDAEVNPETAELVTLLAAHGTLRAAIGELATRRGLDDDVVARLSAQAVEIVKDMWASGYFVLGEEATPSAASS